MRTLIFERKNWKYLQELCEAGYPKEVCGLLLGRPTGKQNVQRVAKVVQLENILNGKHSARLEELLHADAIPIHRERIMQGGYFEFVIDPAEHYQQVFQAQKDGLDQIGIFHSHPDHPARPSGTDEAQPFLAGWSSVIVSVHQKKFMEAQSWFRETENSAFQKENILIE